MRRLRSLALLALLAIAGAFWILASRSGVGSKVPVGHTERETGAIRSGPVHELPKPQLESVSPASAAPPAHLPKELLVRAIDASTRESIPHAMIELIDDSELEAGKPPRVLLSKLASPDGTIDLTEVLAERGATASEHPGQFLRTSADGYRPILESFDLLQRKAAHRGDTAASPLEVVLHAAEKWIDGKVVRRDGTPVPDASVRILATQFHPTSHASLLGADEYHRGAVIYSTASDDGTFRAGPLLHGGFVDILVYANGFPPLIVAAMELPEGELRLVLPDAYRSATITVSDERGRPVEGIAVTATIPRISFGPGLPRDQRGTTDAHGVVTFTGLAATAYGVYVTIDSKPFRTDGAAQSLDLREDLHKDLSIVLKDALTIRGQILRQGSNSPVPGVPLWADGATADSLSRESNRSDAEGRFQLQSPQFGIHRVALSLFLPDNVRIARVGSPALVTANPVRWDAMNGVDGVAWQVLAELRGTSSPLELMIFVSDAVRISGVVLDPNGKPVSGIRVDGRLASPGDGELLRQFTHTGRAGIFRMVWPPGAGLELLAQNELGRAVETLNIDAGSVPPPVILKMVPGKSVVGVALRADGQPLPGWSLELLSTDPEDSLRAPRAAISDKLGRFEFAGVPPGRYALQLKQGLHSKPEDVRSGTTPKPLDIEVFPDADPAPIELRLLPTVAFVGIVQDDDGEPVEGVTVRFRSHRFREVLAAKSGADGRFIADGWPDPFVAATMTVDAPGFPKIPMRDVHAGREPIEITLTRPTPKRLRVLDHWGNTVARYRYRVSGTGAPPEFREWTTVADGTAQEPLLPVPTSDHGLMVHVEALDEGSSPTPRTGTGRIGLSIREDNHLTVYLLPKTEPTTCAYRLRILEGKTKQPVPGVALQLAVNTAGGVQTFLETTGADGLAVFEDIPAGIAPEVSYRGGGAEGTRLYRNGEFDRLRLPIKPTDLELELHTPGTISGTILGADGKPAYGATVELQDLLSGAPPPRAVADRDGRYWITGRHWNSRHPEYLVIRYGEASSGSVAFEPTSPGADVVLDYSFTRQCSVAVRVLRPDGSTHLGSFHLRFVANGESLAGAPMIFDMREPGITRHRLSPGAYRVFVGSDHVLGILGDLEVPQGCSEEIDFRATLELATADVVVVTPPGSSPPAWCLLDLEREMADGTALRFAQIHLQGVTLQHLSQLQPGRYRLVHHTGLKGPWCEVTTGEENAIVIDLPASE